MLVNEGYANLVQEIGLASLGVDEKMVSHTHTHTYTYKGMSWQLC